MKLKRIIGRINEEDENEKVDIQFNEGDPVKSYQRTI